MDYIMTTEGLTKIYGSKAAAEDINIHIREGEVYGLIGRNGAGKTTIMRMLSGLSNPTSGSFTMFGKSGCIRWVCLSSIPDFILIFPQGKI